MMAPLPDDEAQRLDALRRFDILDTPPEQAFDDLTRLASQICGTPIALITFVDESRHWFKSKVGMELSETPREAAFCEYAIAEQDLCVVGDARADERFATNPRVVSEPYIRFYAGMPLRTPEGFALGTLCVLDSVPHELTPEQMDALRTLGRQVMAQLELRRHAASREKDLERAREALRTEGALRDLFMESATDAMVALDLEGRFTLVNRRACEMTGRSEDELLGKRLTELIPPDAVAGVAAQFSRVTTEHASIQAYETDVVRPDGSMVRVAFNVAPLLRDGRLIGAAATAEDITERSRAEEALKASEARYRALAENAFDLVCELDSEGRFAYVSPNFKQILGYEPAAMIGEVAFSFIHPEDRERVGQEFAGAIANPASGTIAFRLRRSDGRWSCLEASANIFQNDAGESRAVIVSRDIGERMAMEETLRESEARYRDLIENANDIVYTHDLQGNFTSVNEAGLRTYGLKAEDVATLNIRELVHPEWLATAVENMQSKLSGNVERSEAYELLTRARDGTAVWVEVSTRLLRVDGQPAGVHGIARDITERKRAEEKVRESEEKLRTLVTNAPLVLFSTDRDGVFTLFDGKGVEQLGVARGQYVGESIFEAIAAFPDITDGARRVLAGETVTYLFRGERVALEIHQSPVRDVADAIVGTIGLVINVTDRVRAEDELHQSEERLRTVVGNVPVILFATDREGVYTLSEGAGLQAVGLKPGQYVGQSVFDVYAGLPQVTDSARRALAGESVTYLLRLGGAALDVHQSPIRDLAGGIIGSIGVAIDVSDRQRAEEGMNRRAEELEQMYRRLAGAHAELEESQAHLEEQSSLLEQALRLERERSRHDQLTGALNHAAITDTIRELIREDAERSLAIAMVDVDGLKAANDTYGHQVGDAVLVLVAQKLKRDGAIVGRYGGDEFVAILAGADRKAAEQYRHDVLASLVGAGLTDERTGAHIPVVASIGLAMYPEEAGAVDDLIRLSDSAMYASRRQRVSVEGGAIASRALGSDRAAKMVGEIVPLLTSPGALQDKLRLVAHRLSVGAGYDGVNFLIEGLGDPRQASSSAVERVAPSDLDEWNRRQLASDNRRVAALLIRTMKPILIDDIETTELLPEAQRHALTTGGLRSTLIAPMIWQDRLIGALSVASKRRNAFTVRDVEFLAAVATQVTAIVRMSSLVEELQTSTSQLQQAHEGTVMMLASAAEAHDHTTGRHLQRVREITEAIARELGYDDAGASALGMAAILHDIGKIRVPDSVLGSPNSLAEAEWVLMKQHTLWGAAFLSAQPGFELAASVARHHHERWDGAGYPDGLAGDAIPESALITTVADSFDAMTNNRPYRRGRPVGEAVREIQSCAGTQFSPRVVDALVRLFERGDLAFVHPDEEELAAA